MSFRGSRRCRKKEQEWTCKKLTMRSIKIGQRSVNGQRKCSVRKGRIARQARSETSNVSSCLGLLHSRHDCCSVVVFAQTVHSMA